MKQYTFIAMAFMVLLVSALASDAKTVTEGTLNIQNLATRISADLRDYSLKRDRLVDNIRSTQKGIQKLKKDYEYTQSEKERFSIRAQTLHETSQLLDFYSQFYNLNLQKVKAILPNLEKMKQAARNGALGKAARQLEDPEFKKNLTTLYGNLSSFAIKFNDARLKKEVATLLRENELLYSQGKKGHNAFNDILKNIDKVADYLRSIYARTVLRSRILKRKKVQTEMAVELMQYALALKPIGQTMLQINPEGVMDVPEIDVADFVDPILSDTQVTGSREPKAYHDPEVDAELRRYQNKPEFLK